MFEIDYGLILAQIINFLIIFFIFKKFVSDSMGELIENRKKLLEKLSNADFYYDQKKQEALNEEKEIIKSAHIEANKFITQTEDIALRKYQDLIEKANKEVMYILDGGKKEIEKERLTMLSQMKSKIFDLSIKINQKIFNDDEFTKKFIEDNIDKEVK